MVLSLPLYIVLGAAIGLKLLCYIVCQALSSQSDSMLALAEDHLNDILSNAAAVVAAVAAWMVVNGWWIDPTGAVLISLYIVWRWIDIAKQQVRCGVGLEMGVGGLGLQGSGVRGLGFGGGWTLLSSRCGLGVRGLALGVGWEVAVLELGWDWALRLGMRE